MSNLNAQKMQREIRRQAAMKAELVDLDRRAEKLVRGGAIIRNNAKGWYVGGNPYLWTAFRDRAFRFKDAGAAQDFARRHSLKTVEVVALDK